MLFSRAALPLFAAAALLALPSLSRADDTTFGGDARAFAMGGAGLALSYSAGGGGSRYNPATLAIERRGFELYAPSFGIRAREISADDAAAYLTDGGDSREDALILARQLSRRDATLGVNANAGFRFSNFEIYASGIGRGFVLPNQSLQNYVNQTGRIDSNAPADARSDVRAGGYYTLPTVGYAFNLPRKKLRDPQVSVGTRVKYMRSFYTHYFADRDTLLRSGSAALAPEMNGDSVIEKSGVGVDVGVLARNPNGFSYAFLVNNLIKPGFDIDNATGRNGDADPVNLLATTFSLGSAYTKKGVTFAADLVDITGAAGEAQFRAGVELRAGRALAVRGGYNSANGLSYGLGLFGFNVSFSRNAPLEVGRTLRF